MATTTKKGSKNTKAKPRGPVVKTSVAEQAQTHAELRQQLAESLQRENATLPDFSRFGWFTAYGEGWALYAESLGDELGIYHNRRDRLDMLFNEEFRAARLVVDVRLSGAAGRCAVPGWHVSR